jgi:hypothetical protein
MRRGHDHIASIRILTPVAALGCGLVATTRTEFGMSNLARVHAVKKNVVEILIFIS